jgi:hypothetical protein
VIEFWVTNRLLIEVATPLMVQEYLDFLKVAQTAMISDPRVSSRDAGDAFERAGKKPCLAQVP